MADASDPSEARPVNRLVDPHGLTPLMEALKWAEQRRRALDPAGIVVSEDIAEQLDRRGWYFTAYELSRECVESGRNPLELKEAFSSLSAGNDAMRAIAFQSIEDAWFASIAKQG